MSASRFLLFGTSLFRSQKPLFLSLPPQLLSSKPCPSLSLRFQRYTCSAAAVDTLNDKATATGPLDWSASQPHPWPEWVDFVDRLKSKGYLVEATGSVSDAGTDYTDTNFLKDACLSFARDRFDLFKLLSANDIEKLVGSGCPNLLRKAVNSAKRLRAYAQLDEGDICSICNLRGSCDRAYVILKGSEAAARTVDVVRILLSYALDPLVISGGEKPPGREHIENSARNLLSDLTKLSETSPAAELPSSATKAPPRKVKVVSGKDDEDEVVQDIEMKRGDWMCPECNYLNFARNKQCRNCEEDGPKNVAAFETEKRAGDWTCSECGFLNFARNIRCFKCRADCPKKVDTREVMKKGDWNCPGCGYMNFASNSKCKRCQEKKPPRQLNPGEWECPSCNFLNYGRQVQCRKCQEPKKKAGDWTCSECGFLNFANNSKCKHCQVKRPLNGGDWLCPSCDYLNYSRNEVCRKCNHERGPGEQRGEDDDEHTWRRPVQSH